MKAKRKMYQAGGGAPKKYKDARGTYVIGANGQKIYDGNPVKTLTAAKPAAAAAKPAAAATGAAKTQVRPDLSMTAGESLGKKLQDGDISAAARQMGEAITGVPGELYRAFKRSMR